MTPHSPTPSPSRLVPWLLAALGLLALGLCAASVGTLWRTGSLVLQRERSRSEATRALVNADAAITRQVAPAWAFIPTWPDTLSAPEWEVIDAFLADQSSVALADFPRVESGFYLPAHDLYLGHARGSARPEAAPDSPEPPTAARETVRSQTRLTLSRTQPQLTISGPTADPLAVRTALVRGPDGRVEAILWTITRLGGPLFHDVAAARGYRSAASLSVAGIGLALFLALALAWAARRHALERARLRAELRRSERLAALGKLLAGVAHEVRNPLAGIRSSVQLWQRGLGPDDGSMASVVAEVDRIDGLVAQLLRFSRTQQPKLAPGDLNDLVRQAADLATPEAESRGVRVELRLADQLPRIDMDPPALLQVLRNLTRNALQAMPTGGRLLLSTQLAPGGRAAEARVADTGPGLPPETRAHLFEPFFTTRPDGTGLGLAIAREIALAHRGDLLASDAPPASGVQTAGPSARSGPGALFTLRLPLHDP